MTEEFKLEDKIEVFQDAFVEGCKESVTADVITTEHIKQKLKDFKEELKEGNRTLNEIDKLYIKHFGEKLTQSDIKENVK